MALINIIYPHTAHSGTALHKGETTVVWSAEPLSGFDVYGYSDAFSFRGNTSGIDVLLLLEPAVVLPGEYGAAIWDCFDHVLTFTDALAARNPGKFHKFLYPVYDRPGKPIFRSDPVDRFYTKLSDKRNAICMINGHKVSHIPGELYSLRVKAARWFHQHSKLSFDVFGRPPFSLPNYRGELNPFRKKFDTLSKYRYGFCIENVYHPIMSTGYLSEKLPHCLISGTVPIYLGCYNVEQYVPSELFVDFREFRDLEDLDRFLKSLDDRRYRRYLDDIRSWVAAGNLKPYSMFSVFDTLEGFMGGDTDSRQGEWAPGRAPVHAELQWRPLGGSPQWSWEGLAEMMPQDLESDLMHSFSGPALKVDPTWNRIADRFLNEEPAWKNRLIKRTEKKRAPWPKKTIVPKPHTPNQRSQLPMGKPKLLIVSLHKCGTHLVKNIFEQVGMKARMIGPECSGKHFSALAPNEYFLSHYTPATDVYGLIETGQVRAVLNFRDPRDTCVSRFNWHHPSNGKVTNLPREFMKRVHGEYFKSNDDFLTAIIRGEKFFPQEIVLADTFRNARGLLFHPHVHKTRFEDLVGTRGGGDAKRQLEAVGELIKFAQIDADPRQVAEQAFSVNAKTFNKGTIGRYKTVLKTAHLELFNTLHGDILREYGYDPALPARQIVPSPDVMQPEDDGRLNLPLFFRDAPEYVLLRLSDRFPDYADFSDLDILCRDRQRFLSHILNTAEPYRRAGFSIRTETTNGHLHADFYKPGQSRLHFRFDLVDTLQIYQQFKVNTDFAGTVLNQRQKVRIHDTDIFLPALEDDLALRFLEFVEHKDLRPDKIKHLRHIENINSYDFIHVVNRFTDLEVSIDRQGEKVRLNVEKKEGELMADRKPETAGDASSDLKTPLPGRMDYFLIWGHGLPYTDEILQYIRNQKEMEIVAIHRKTVLDVAKFIEDVYACDTVPMEHLRAKTRYLLKTEPEVIFILVRNQNPQEQLYGEGPFRHIQCARIKSIKETIRNRFNPRFNGRRTENHVIHASDYQSQVEHVLGVMGLKPLSYYLRRPHPELDAPYHLPPLASYRTVKVSLECLYANIIGQGLTPIIETPHFRYLSGDPSVYCGYIQRHLGRELTDDHAPEAFDQLADAFQYNPEERPEGRRLIIVRQIPQGRFQILDGVHRAAILKSHEVREVTVAVVESVRQPEQIPSENEQVLGIVFSKDRALQLDGALKSFYRHCLDPRNVKLHVLFKASSQKHEKQYQALFAEYPQVRFAKETDFKSDLLNPIKSGAYPYLFFMVDDNLFVRPFSFSRITKGLSDCPEAIGFSLRLGNNTTVCYMQNRPQQVPELEAAAEGIFRYAWPDAEADFGYPLEVSSSVYRTPDLFSLLQKESYVNPNTLELKLSACAEGFKKTLPQLLLFKTSVAFCNPVNMVQTAWENRCGKRTEYDADRLAEKFDQGWRIQTESFSGLETKSCHQEIPFEFIRRRPLVSILILNHNRMDDLRQCLESIERHTPEPHEIIVIDNASTDGSVPYLRGLADIRLVENKENIGCPPARAQGMAMATGRYVLLLDNDTVVTPGWLERLLGHADGDPSVGLVGPMSNFVSGPQRVKEISYGNLQELDAAAQHWARRHMGKRTSVSRLVGFCMLIRRTVIDRIGGPDPLFGKFGFEDDDYTWRAIIAGFKAVIAHDVFIHHTGGPQLKGDPEYNGHLKQAWDILKMKWRLPRELSYGTPFNVNDVLSRPFSPADHYIPIPEPDTAQPKAGGQVDLAPADFQAASAVMLEKGRNLIAAGRMGEAEAILKDVVGRQPQNATALNCLGELYRGIGKDDAAIEQFIQALQVDPYDRSVVINCSRILTENQRDSAARSLVANYLKVHPEDREMTRSLSEAR